MRGELETGAPDGAPVSCRDLAGLRYVAGLLAFGTVDDLEFDRLTFLERPEPSALDCAEKWTNTSFPPSRSMKP